MLTAKECENATCPPGKTLKRFADAGGLYLQVSPGGSKRWFLKYRTGCKEKQLALGSYPAVSLSDARLARDAAKAQKKQGTDPAKERHLAHQRAKLAQQAAQAEIDRQRQEAELTIRFTDVAAEFMALRATTWSEKHRLRNEYILNTHLLPTLGNRPMLDIKTPVLVATLRQIETRGTLAMLDKAQALCSGLWGYAVTVGKAEVNIATGIRKAFKVATARHYPAIIDPMRFGELMRHIRAYQGGLIVRAALQLTPLVFQRPGEIRAMAWAEVDLDNALWTIAPERMKREKAGKENGPPHLVPLSRQAVEILRGLHPVTGHCRMVFPGERSRDRPMSENSIRVALLSMGFPKEEHTAHGFRASARTMLAERLNYDPLIIEAQLAHAVPDSLGTAYNRTKYLEQRRAMMQAWADYLDGLVFAGDNVRHLPVRAA